MHKHLEQLNGIQLFQIVDFTSPNSLNLGSDDDDADGELTH